MVAGPSSLARMMSVYWQVLESLAAACKKWAAQANARIGEMKCVGGTDVQLSRLHLDLDEDQMAELLAQCCDQRFSDFLRAAGAILIAVAGAWRSR